MLRRVVAGLAVLLAVVAVAVTLLPLSPSSAWWVRMWEFPRQHVAIGAVVTALLAAALPSGPRGLTVVAMLVVAGWQASWVWPHMPWAEETVPIEDGAGARIVSLNVLQDNDDHAAVRAYLRDADADVLLLMETDAVWAEALAPVLDAYPHRIDWIADDYYGMIFVTRLEPDRLEMADLGDGSTPAAVAVLRHDGRPFVVTGLHPRPPVPGTSTQERDAQIAMAATLADRSDLPAVTVGDFNDVSWSRAGQRFREVGGYADPRVGRGILASFAADSWWMKFPIDQGLVTDDVRLHRFGLGPEVGSDHLPVEMEVSVRP